MLWVVRQTISNINKGSNEVREESNSNNDQNYSNDFLEVVDGEEVSKSTSWKSCDDEVTARH